jgi:hypothetical protein
MPMTLRLGTLGLITSFVIGSFAALWLLKARVDANPGIPAPEIAKRGVIRYQRFGEGGYAQTEQQIQALIAEREKSAR